LTRVNSSDTLLIPAAAGINQLRKDREMEKKILTASLRSAMFGDRGGDVIAALEYAHEVINAMPESSSRAPAFTALHVVMNTIANAIDALELPADNPAAGVTGFEDALIKLIDARVKYYLDDMDLTSDLDDKIQEYIDNSVDFTEIVRDEIRQNISFSVEVD